MIKSSKYFKKISKLIKLPPEVSAIDNTYNNKEPLGGFFTDDFDYAKQFFQSHKDIFAYTIVVDEGDLYITDGWHIVDRIAYAFSYKKLDVNALYSH